MLVVLKESLFSIWAKHIVFGIKEVLPIIHMTTQFPIWVEQCEIKIYPRICKIVRNCATSLKSLSSAFFSDNYFLSLNLTLLLNSNYHQCSCPDWYTLINALTRINVTIFLLDFFQNTFHSSISWKFLIRKCQYFRCQSYDGKTPERPRCTGPVQYESSKIRVLWNLISFKIRQTSLILVPNSTFCTLMTEHSHPHFQWWSEKYGFMKVVKDFKKP